MTVDEAKGRCGADRHLPRLDARTGRAAPSGEPEMVSLWLRSGGQYSQSRSVRSAGQSAAESRMKRQVWMKGCGRYQSRFFAVSVPHYRYCGAAAAQYPQARRTFCMWTARCGDHRGKLYLKKRHGTYGNVITVRNPAGCWRSMQRSTASATRTPKRMDHERRYSRRLHS